MIVPRAAAAAARAAAISADPSSVPPARADDEAGRVRNARQLDAVLDGFERHFLIEAKVTSRRAEKDAFLMVTPLPTRSSPSRHLVTLGLGLPPRPEVRDLACGIMTQDGTKVLSAHRTDELGQFAVDLEEGHYRLRFVRELRDVRDIQVLRLLGDRGAGELLRSSSVCEVPFPPPAREGGGTCGGSALFGAGGESLRGAVDVRAEQVSLELTAGAEAARGSIVRFAIGEAGKRPLAAGTIDLRPAGRPGDRSRGASLVAGRFPPRSRAWIWLAPFRDPAVRSGPLQLPQAAASEGLLQEFGSEDGALVATLRWMADGTFLDVELALPSRLPCDRLAKYEVVDGEGNVVVQGFLGLHPARGERLSGSTRLGQGIVRTLEGSRLQVKSISRRDVGHEDRADLERSFDATEHPESRKVLDEVLHGL